MNMKLISACFALPFLVAACSGPANLEPAETAQPAEAADDTASASAEGVRVVTRTVPWPGAVRIERKVTPLRVRIENGSRIPVDVRYRDLSLLAPDGKRYNAIPPYRIDKTVSSPVIDTAYAPITEPGFVGEGFEIAPYYSPAYPEMAVYEDVFVYDPFYYDNAYAYWNETELPTYEMLQHALPEGVIQAGGNVEGWVYFQKVPDEADSVVLRTDIVNSRTGQQFAEVRIPYRVN